MPWLYQSSWGITGIVIAPDAQVLCAFPADVGTGGHPNGRCFGADRETVGSDWRDGPQYTGHDLKDALEAQYDGSYRKSHWGASGYK